MSPINLRVACGGKAKMLAGTAAFIALFASSAAIAAPRLSPIWGEHAVIQRNQPILVEGRAAPGEAVTITLGAERQQGRAGKDGRFALRFAPRPANAGPITLVLEGKNGVAARLSDLVVGDVWLCSGQSNMELTVDRALNAWGESQSANDDKLRMITIPKSVAEQPADDFGGPVSWAATTPQTVNSFSAACYFMAKELRRRLDVPIGAIHSSWGGSQSRPWLTPEGGRAIYGDAEMNLLARYTTDPVGAVAQFAPRWQDWYRFASGGTEPWGNPDGITWQAVPKISPWNDWKGTRLADNPVGLVWLRRTIELTQAQASGEASLSIGAIDDMDMTWVNGHPIGNNYGWDRSRTYRLPAGVLRAGANEIVIGATNSWGGGGFVSGPSSLFLTTSAKERLLLDDGWRYSVSAVTGFPPRSPWDNNAGIGVMHNRMIAPIGHFALKGAAWYQGESDVGTPGYAQRLKALFAGWRRQFGADMRMMVVQLTNFGGPHLVPTASAWAELREEQRQGVLADGNAALVTAIDLGERLDIHPANKNELGRRLASAALGDALPQPLSATRTADGVRVRFSGVEGALSAWSGNGPLGFELCGEDQASCHFVTGRAEGDSVLIPDDGKQSTRVRYGWADSPVLNLYDARPLPPPSFELRIVEK